ncbi:MAG: geranylgeranylglyceryl/heptaprenylglyceryl phosphate synthase, partial [Bacteroidota bacterium]
LSKSIKSSNDSSCGRSGSIRTASCGYADMVLVGGSTSGGENVDALIRRIKRHTDVPVILFPGNSYQIAASADGILFLSLISGRNADYLIGRQVEAAPLIKACEIPVIPTGYIMVSSGGPLSTASYLTQTLPIPMSKPEVAAQTALAGEMLGMQAIYLEAGSGATQEVSSELIQRVKSSISIPLIVGGGISYPGQVVSAVLAGANVLVIGTAIEEDPEVLVSLRNAIRQQISVHE